MTATADNSDVQCGTNYNNNKRVREDEELGRWHDTDVEIVKIIMVKYT